MQFNIVFVLKSIVVPAVAILIPFAMLGIRLAVNDLSLVLSKKRIIVLLFRWILLSVLIFILLSYLTGDLAYLFFVESGMGTIQGGFYLNFGNHWNFTFRIDPGISLLAVALLSGLLYASIWTLPPICTNIDYEAKNEQDGHDEVDKKQTISSSLTASISAIASTTVCCSTSVAALIAPAITTILGPFVPFLLYLSMALLIYTIYRIVLPRFPKNSYSI